jgi:magnesium chelatase accessory protein
MPHELTVARAVANADWQGEVATPAGRLYCRLLGSGPDLLLIHGTGASSHSWARLLPELAGRFRLLVPDLPGHGASPAPRHGRYSPAAMIATLKAVQRELEFQPAAVVGHSAGAALGAWLLLDEPEGTMPLVALAPAMLGFGGMRQVLFGGLARVLALNPLVPRMVAWRASDPTAVARLLAGVGSPLPQRDVAEYVALLRRPDHVAAVLQMMADWDLAPLAPRLRELQSRLLLVSGERDRAVPPEEIVRLRRLVPDAAHQVLAAGHLLHEEQPRVVIDLLERWLARQGVAQ